jgi:hypothetical protein
VGALFCAYCAGTLENQVVMKPGVLRGGTVCADVWFVLQNGTPTNRGCWTMNAPGCNGMAQTASDPIDRAGCAAIHALGRG